MADEERLVVLLEARVRDFEKRMDQAERRGTQSFTKLRQSSASATRAMEADMIRSTGRINQALSSVSSTIGAFGRGFLGGVAGGALAFGLTGIVNAARDAAKGIAEIGNEAKRAGVSAQAFQEWKYVAEQNRIGIDAMVDGLKEMNLRADEFIVTGKGPAAEAFARLGYNAEELREKLKNPSALLLEIIGRLGDLDRAAQIRIADEIFGGTGGERFVELIAQGEDGIRRTIAEAHKLGAVMDAELIQRADDLNRMFQSVATTVGSSLKAAIVNASAALVDFLRLWRDFDQQRSESLQGQLNATIQERAKLIEEQQALQSGDGLTDTAKSLGFGSDGKVTQQRIGELQTQIDALTSQEDQIIGVLKSRQPAAPSPVSGAASTAPAVDTEDSRTNRGVVLAYAEQAKRQANELRAAGGGGGGGLASMRPDELEREIAALEKRTAALKAGTAAQAEINPLITDFGYASTKAAAAQDLLVAAQQAGVAITPELRAQIDQLAEAYAQAEVASNQQQENQDEALKRAKEAAELNREVIGGFARDLMDGATAADAFSNALARVGDHLIDIGLTKMFDGGKGVGGAKAGGGGLLGGLFAGIGSLFGFADGTSNTGGSRGEPRGIVHGQEAVIPLPSGGKVPVEMKGRSSGATDVRVHVTTGVSVDKSGNLMPLIVDVAQSVTRRGMAEVQKSIPDVMARHQQRFR